MNPTQNSFFAGLRPALLSTVLAAACVGEPPTRSDLGATPTTPSSSDVCDNVSAPQIDRFEPRWLESNPPGLRMSFEVQSENRGQMTIIGAPATSFNQCPDNPDDYRSLQTSVSFLDGSTVLTSYGIPGAYRQGSCYSVVQFLDNGCVVGTNPVFVGPYR